MLSTTTNFLVRLKGVKVVLSKACLIICQLAVDSEFCQFEKLSNSYLGRVFQYSSNLMGFEHHILSSRIHTNENIVAFKCN